jgi:uncharacterized membrane protein YdjX (TVP38/TMEM64 family)
VREAFATVVSRLLHPRTRAAVLVVLVMGLAGLVAVVGLPSLDEARRAVAADSPWTPVVAVLGTAALALMLFPRTGTALLGGLLFGPWAATLYIVLGSVLGASVAFGVGRLLGRDYLAELTAGRLETSRLARLDAWLGRRAFVAVVVTRLLPLVPYGLLNYAFGATRVRYGVFVAGTLVGILPNTVLYATVGSAATNPTSPLFLTSAALTAALALAGVVIVGRVDRRRGTQLR